MTLIDATTLETPVVAPHSQEAEEAVLGSVLINPNAFFEVSDFLKSDDFFILRNGWVWEAMERLAARKDVIEYLTVINELRVQGRLDDAGGIAYITYLTSSTATSLHAEAYGHIVERAAVRRRMLEAAAEITRLAREEDSDVEDVTSNAQAILTNAIERKNSVATVTTLRASDDFYDSVEYRYLHPDEIIGVPSGFVDLDRITSGFQNEDLIFIAARPAMGKTSLKLNIASNAAKAGTDVAVFSLEMSLEQLMLRLYATETGINSQNLRLGKLSEAEFKLFVEAKTKIDKLPIHWNDTPAISLPYLRSECLRLKRYGKLGLVIVDYIQLMNGVKGRNYKDQHRVQEISYLSRGLKELARELKVPIIAGSQLSRAVEQRTDKRPILSDLRESGTLEQDADVVMFIYRDDVYNEASERPNEADIIVAKHRNGPTGTATLFFRKQLTQFVNLKKETVSTETNKKTTVYPGGVTTIEDI